MQQVNITIDTIDAVCENCRLGSKRRFVWASFPGQGFGRRFCKSCWDKFLKDKYEVLSTEVKDSFYV